MSNFKNVDELDQPVYKEVGIQHISPNSGRKTYTPVVSASIKPNEGIDNHNQNVTLGATLLGSETAESYIWLLKCFKRAFGYEPSVVVSDQDPAMKRAGEDVFPNSRNRLCMLHIMDKLSGNRHEHRKNDHDCRYKRAETWSNFALEKQASEIYTRTIFFYVQLEIQAALHNCTSMSYLPVDDYLKFNIREFLHLPASFHEVMIGKEDVTEYCSCKRFKQFGLLCRHIFKVTRILDIRVFPKQYINRRGMQDAVSNSPMWSIGFDELNIDKTTDVYCVVRDINIAHDHIIKKLITDMEKLQHYRDYINRYKSTIDEVTFDAPRPSRRDRFVDLTGVTQPEQINIHAPIGVRNKGCGLPIHYRSLREQAISQSQLDKPPRTCRICHEPGHDARNHHKYHINENTTEDRLSSSHNENMEE
ncbi:protein FAR1-RELATED SEQUENCE 5-like [Bidens hawaiensis]|uniref:protein FAR1-RELATED SEQUENCE 5-like n=1 Tax=Bidens hawaiensis TaxID=980011 RepID=UPI00404A3CC9